MLWTLREHDSSAAVTNSVADPKAGPLVAAASITSWKRVFFFLNGC